MTSTNQSDATEEVVYHGYRQPAGGSMVVVETPGGDQIGVLRHLPKHSPTGISWGYCGSGAADCARSLLLAALGSDASCPGCRGTGRVVFDPAVDQEVAYDPALAEDYDPELVASCFDCEGGYRTVPYQQFKSSVVAGWGTEWRMSRSEILAWLENHQTPTRGAHPAP